jgi:hypothetical protein
MYNIFPNSTVWTEIFDILTTWPARSSVDFIDHERDLTVTLSDIEARLTMSKLPGAVRQHGLVLISCCDQLGSEHCFGIRWDRAGGLRMTDDQGGDLEAATDFERPERIVDGIFGRIRDDAFENAVKHRDARPGDAYVDASGVLRDGLRPRQCSGDWEAFPALGSRLFDRARFTARPRISGDNYR